jgi:hypothetical protein
MTESGISKFNNNFLGNAPYSRPGQWRVTLGNEAPLSFLSSEAYTLQGETIGSQFMLKHFSCQPLGHLNILIMKKKIFYFGVIRENCQSEVALFHPHGVY